MPSIDLCEMIATTITGDDNQHATLMITATTGAGKSYAGIAIAERVSQIVAEIKGGVKEDYFTLEDVAVITQEEILRVMARMNNKKYHCFGLDDIGAYTWQSRAFMQETNQQFNAIFQTFRTQNNFLYLTLPNDSLIDVTARRLTKYRMEITASHFDNYYVEAKVFKSIKSMKLPHGGIEPYLLDLDGRKIKRHIIFVPSQHLIDEYDKRRAAIESQATGITIDDMLKNAQTESVPTEPRLSKKVLFSQPMKIDYNDGNGLKMWELAKKYGVSTQTVHEALHYNPSPAPP